MTNTVKKFMTVQELKALEIVLNDTKLVHTVFKACYTPQECYDRLGVSLRQAQHLCQQGRLGFKVGKRYYITEREVQKFERERAPSKS